MPTVNFILSDGQVCEMDAQDGQTVMEVAKQADIESIMAECGGSLSCATCHVYVESDWQDLLPAPDEAEEDLLDCVPDRQSGSRLSCQIVIKAALDGLTVRVPDAQF